MATAYQNQIAATVAATNKAAAAYAARHQSAAQAAPSGIMTQYQPAYMPKRHANLRVVKGTTISSVNDTESLHVLVAEDEQSLDAAITASGLTGETYAICADGPGDMTGLLNAAAVILNIELPEQYREPSNSRIAGANGRLYRVVHLDATNFYKQFMSYVRPTHYASAIWAELNK
jgi:hypothetical protein